MLIYSIASGIRDWELMVAYSAKAGRDPTLDPFVIISSKPLEKDLMTEYGLIDPTKLPGRRVLRRRGTFDAVRPSQRKEEILPPVPS